MYEASDCIPQKSTLYQAKHPAFGSSVIQVISGLEASGLTDLGIAKELDQDDHMHRPGT